MSRIDEHFHEYFSALDRAGQQDRCFLCRRTPADVKLFFGFDEDGVALEADRHGLEDITLEPADIMSYRGERPVCAVCQINLDGIHLLDEGPVLLRVLDEMATKRELLWPEPPRTGGLDAAS